MPTFALSSHDDDIFLLKVLPAVPAARLALLFVSIKMPSTSGAEGIFFGLFVSDLWLFRFVPITRRLEISAVLVEFSAVLAGISASTAEISGMPMLFLHTVRECFSLRRLWC